MGLILKLKKGEHLIVNGALIRFETASKIVLKTKSAVMHDRQIMRPEEVTTPGARIYFAIQNAYMAEEGESATYVEQARARIVDFRQASGLSTVHETLDHITGFLENTDYFQALQLTRQLLEFEAALLDMADAGTPTDLDIQDEFQAEESAELEKVQ
ncbi:flagellar biosynthesis repressor FlbT [Fodinicurvata halophila]|uniref:Flagellar biosynthesis repressor FlbT n=1 Tax=Fodinicurvata halophila TaxID=1419723 RepID=A0ABV8UKG5_9PROT